MARPVGPKLPWQPLRDALGQGTDQELAWRLGITRDALEKIKHRGCVSVDHADRLAVAAGLHPAMVWDEWARDVA